MRNNKKLAGVLLAVAMVLWAPFAHAQSLSVNKIADLSFGTIDFDTPTASGDITMGTNGSVTYGTNTSGNGLGTAGQIQVDATPGTTVTIACTNSASLALPGHTSLPITPIRFVIGTANVGTYAAATECIDAATSSATFSISATASENTINIGGILAINGITLANGTYNGANSGGSMPSFTVLVQ